MSGSEKTGDNFSKSWQNAFRDREVSPPDHVWAGIDRSLANAEVLKYKKRAMIYKWAAVVAILLMTSASVALFWQSSSQENSMAEVTSESDRAKMPTSENPGPEPAVSETILITEKSEISTESPQTNTSGTGSMMLAYLEEEDIQKDSGEPTFSIRSKSWEEDLFTIEDEKILAVKEAPQPFYVFKKFVPDRKRSNADKDKLWAAVEFGSGSYNPNYSSNSSNSVAAAMLTSSQKNFVNTSSGRTATPSIEESMAAGLNYQVGINLGMRIVDRWTIEGGMQYTMAQTTTNTNIIIENRFFTESVALTSEAASIEAVADIADQQEIIEYREDDLNLENTFQFASFPLKAGYVIMDKKFNLRVNAGMIANFYLGNTLEDNSDRVATLSINPGSNSPYRDVSFSGITGISMGYQYMDRFNFTIEPNYVHALAPFTKASSNFDFSPTGLGVMAGIRYSLR